MTFMCKHKDIFGKPGTGAHKYRLFGFAAVDIIATSIVSVVISHFSGLDTTAVFIGLIILSIVAHGIFCVDTTLMKLLFGKGWSKSGNRSNKHKKYYNK